MTSSVATRTTESGRGQESWRRWAWEVCAACDGLGWRVFCGKGRLHVVAKSAKVDSVYYVGRLLPSLVDDCTRLLPRGYIFQQDGAPAHTALPRRTGSNPTAQLSLPKTSGLQIHPTWTPWIAMSGGQCWRPITSAIRNRKRSPNLRKSCRWSGTAYFRDQ